jgi:DNA-binding transcriptional LysR family regulator
MKLTLEALEAIDAIERRGSYAAAAEELHKVPSAISYIVQKLESDLGVTVFDRTGHRAKLTDTGRLLLRQGRQLLRAAADLQCRASRIESGWEAELRIVLDSIVPFSAIVPYITAFYGDSTATRLSFLRESCGGVWSALATRRADLAIGAVGDPAMPGLACRPLGELEVVYCVAPAHPLAAVTEPLSQRQLDAYRRAALANSPHAPSRDDLGSDLCETVVIPDLDAGLALCMSGLGGGFFPEYVVAEPLRQGLLIRKELVTPLPPLRYCVAWHAEDGGEALKWWLRHLDRPNLVAEMWRV